MGPSPGCREAWEQSKLHQVHRDPPAELVINPTKTRPRPTVSYAHGAEIILQYSRGGSTAVISWVWALGSWSCPRLSGLAGMSPH